MACACCQSESCACVDTCVYSIEQVSPLAVKHSPFSCGFPASSQVTASSLITSLLPFSISGQNNFSASLNQSTSVSSNAGSSLAVQNGHSANGFISIPNVGSNLFSASSNAGIAVGCNFNENFIRRFSITLSCRATARIYFSSLVQTTTGYWDKSYIGQFEIPSTCISGQGKVCVYSGQEVQQITTPLTITLNGGTSSLGSLALTADSGYGDHMESAKNAVDSILGGLSYTVIITSRQSCNEAP